MRWVTEAIAATDWCTHPADPDALHVGCTGIASIQGGSNAVLARTLTSLLTPSGDQTRPRTKEPT